MKLAVSNIAWDAAEQPEVLEILAAADVTGIEIAPTKIWPEWIGATPEAAARLRADLQTRGFVVPALQSILFGRNELHVFGDHSGLVDHISHVAALAGALGASVMVFGSPRNRLRGMLSEAEAMRRAVPVFREIGEACSAAGTCLGIEANPSPYGGDFLLTWREAAELVALVDHPGIVLHFDTACTAMAGDDPVEAVTVCGRQIRHFHVSAPWLAPVGGIVDRSKTAPDSENAAIDHRGVATALRASGYTGFVSVEMRRTDTPVMHIRQAVDFARTYYG